MLLIYWYKDFETLFDDLTGASPGYRLTINIPEWKLIFEIRLKLIIVFLLHMGHVLQSMKYVAWEKVDDIISERGMQ